MPQQKADNIPLFRQSVALLSAGYLLVSIGEPTQILVIGIILLLAFLFFLITALLQIFNKAINFTQSMKSFGDYLTILFIITGTYGVLIKWADTKRQTIEGILPVVTADQWLISIRETLITEGWIIYLVLGLLILFVIVQFVNVVKNTIDMRKQLGGRRTTGMVVVDILLVLGFFGIAAFTNYSSVCNNILLGLSLLLVAVMSYCWIKLRSMRMDNKEKIRKNSIAIETTADLIGEILKLPHPPEILKATLKVPLEQLEYKLQNLKHDVDELK